MRINAPKAEGLRIVMNWLFTDTGEQFCLTLANSALSTSPRRLATAPDATVTMTRATLDAVVSEATTFQTEVASGAVRIDGNPAKLFDLMALLDTFERMFEIVEPRRTTRS